MLLENPWVFHHDTCLHSISNNVDDENKSCIVSVAVSEYHNSIAVATLDGLVTLYFSNVQSKEYDSPFTTDILAPQGESYCSQISWQHKSGSLLVVGRADGQIMCVDVLPSSQLTNDRRDEIILTGVHSNVHIGTIVEFLWNKSQDDHIYLLSADDTGCCCLWRTETDKVLAPVMRYDNNSKVNAVAFVESMFPLVRIQTRNFEKP
jgi:WD40 repeat protein